MEDFPPLEPAPAPLDLVQDLVNTWFGRLSGGGREDLHSPAALAAWARAHGVDLRPDEVTEDDVALARVVREGVRALLAPHNDARLDDVDPDALAALGRAAAELPVAVGIDPADAAARPTLQPVADGARGLLARVLAAPVVSESDDWRRLKICREGLCRTAFYDVSRNGSKVWCSMEACGAFNKKRAFVERRRARAAAGRS